MTIPKKRQHLIDVFIEKNGQINLSSIRDPDSIYVKHILDSIELLKKIDLAPGTTLADVGTGGGFPLLPLAIENPQVHFVGIDARKKKTLAVQDIAHQLGLKNTKVVRSRIEDIQQTFDYVTARAVGFADKIIPWCAPLVERGGMLILYKILSDEEEPVLLELAEQKGFTLNAMHFYKLYDDDIQRVIYIFNKSTY